MLSFRDDTALATLLSVDTNSFVSCRNFSAVLVHIVDATNAVL